jgi:hypothetical protein
MHTSVNLRSAEIKSVAGMASAAGDGFKLLSPARPKSSVRDSQMNDHDLIAAPLAKISSQVPARGRPIKFTPERIQQIKNLVERGKSREEIAELIEVTVGSLQVTCSRLGISLRRPRLDNGTRLLPRGTPVPSNGRTTPDPSCDVSVPLQPIGEESRQDSQPGPPERTRHTTTHQERAQVKEADLANLTLTMHYKGEERTTKLALTQLAIGQLALEAGLRDVTIGEFVSELVTGLIQKNLLQRVLDIS